MIEYLHHRRRRLGWFSRRRASHLFKSKLRDGNTEELECLSTYAPDAAGNWAGKAGGGLVIY